MTRAPILTSTRRTPENAAAIAQADVVVVNGAGYDDFMDKLLQASPSDTRVVVSVEQVLGATGSDVNPHLWYDLTRLPEVTAAIEQASGRQGPQSREGVRREPRHVRRLAQAHPRRHRDHPPEVRRRPGRLHRTGHRIPARPPPA